jgi:hypothetical protein
MWILSELHDLPCEKIRLKFNQRDYLNVILVNFASTFSKRFQKHLNYESYARQSKKTHHPKAFVFREECGAGPYTYYNSSIYNFKHTTDNKTKQKWHVIYDCEVHFVISRLNHAILYFNPFLHLSPSPHNLSTQLYTHT